MGGRNNDSGRRPPAKTLAPRAQRILGHARDLCEESLQPLLKHTLDAFDERMFQLADQSDNNTEQETCLASQREVRRGRSNLAPQFLSLLSEGFKTYHLPEDQRAAALKRGAGDLKLVDVDVQEEESIISTAEARLEVRAGMPLLELGYRFAALAGMPVIEAEILPVGPHAIISAWKEAIRELDLSSKHRRQLYQLFSENLLQLGPKMFVALNTLMASQGLLPDLQALMPHQSKGQQNKKTGKQKDSDSAENADTPESTDSSANDSAASPGASGGGMQDTNAAFSVLRKLLARRRHALGMDTQDTGPQGPTSSPEQVQAALAELQQKPAAKVTEDGVSQLRSMEHLRQDLQAQLRRLSKDGKPLALDEKQQDTVDLVSMLFEHLGRDMPMEGYAATMMTRMQVPMMRVALSDPKFFSEHNHPARQLMGSVLDTATMWLDGAGEAADPVLAKKLQSVVDRTVNEFDGNIELLNQLRNDLDSQLSVLKHRAEISDRRHLEAAQGRERLQVARKRANELVTERLQGSDASGLLRTMVEQAWTDVLALSMLRWGERSKAFRHRLELTERLLRHKTTGDDDPELREEITQGLGQVGIHGDEADEIARHVIAPRTETPELTRTELAMRLKQRQRLGSDSSNRGKPEPSEEEIAPATREAMERLKKLSFGDWLEFVQPDKPVLMRKLAWFSPTTGNCLVTSQRGVREDIANIRELGAMMAAGTVRIPEGRGESMLDRAWNSIVKGLRQFAETTAEQSA
jgi:hypothetical protein